MNKLCEVQFTITLYKFEFKVHLKLYKVLFHCIVRISILIIIVCNFLFYNLIFDVLVVFVKIFDIWIIE